MTTETNTAFEGFKDAFKNIQNLEVPEAAREFVKKTANTAKVYGFGDAAYYGSVSEAVEIQSSLLRARGEVFVSRAKATADYFGKLAANGAKSAQDNFAKVYTKTA